MTFQKITFLALLIGLLTACSEENKTIETNDTEASNQLVEKVEEIQEKEAEFKRIFQLNLSE